MHRADGKDDAQFALGGNRVGNNDLAAAQSAKRYGFTECTVQRFKVRPNLRDDVALGLEYQSTDLGPQAQAAVLAE